MIMGYVTGPIKSFVDEDNNRCESPVVQEATDGRNYTVVVLTEPCEDGVEDFSDGEAYSVFGPKSKLEDLHIDKVIRVNAK